MEVRRLLQGVLADIIVQQGTTVSIGAVLGALSDQAATLAAAPPPAPKAEAKGGRLHLLPRRRCSAARARCSASRNFDAAVTGCTEGAGRGGYCGRSRFGFGQERSGSEGRRCGCCEGTGGRTCTGSSCASLGAPGSFASACSTAARLFRAPAPLRQRLHLISGCRR